MPSFSAADSGAAQRGIGEQGGPARKAVGPVWHLTGQVAVVEREALEPQRLAVAAAARELVKELDPVRLLQRGVVEVDGLALAQHVQVGRDDGVHPLLP